MKVKNLAGAETSYSRISRLIEIAKPFEGTVTGRIPRDILFNLVERCEEIDDSMRETYGDQWDLSGDRLLLERMTELCRDENDGEDDFSLLLVDAQQLRAELFFDCSHYEIL